MLLKLLALALLTVATPPMWVPKSVAPGNDADPLSVAAASWAQPTPIA